MKEKFSNHYAVFTDGSKLEQKGCGRSLFPGTPRPLEGNSPGNGASVFSAELEGIALALTEVKKLTKYHKNFVIYSDSLSALQAIQSKNFKLAANLLYNVIRKFPPSLHISFVWIPAHVGIQGNENVDKLAKAALNRASCSGKLIYWSDSKPKINAYIHSVWQRNWDAEGANKLHEVLLNLGEDLHRRAEGAGRKRETAMCRLRVGHTWLTQNYLLKNEERPLCYACDSLYTVRHILIECPDFQDTRRKYFSVTDLYRLFREIVSVDKFEPRKKLFADLKASELTPEPCMSHEEYEEQEKRVEEVAHMRCSSCACKQCRWSDLRLSLAKQNLELFSRNAVDDSLGATWCILQQIGWLDLILDSARTGTVLVLLSA
ncbi:Gag-Pol polyprotein [Plakobranchus ocellatus]|uniref:Gag-Pol polyprotein n=1 Tax=Plakobranchus ocellatus TaxID=259542 RepID=A0AAV4BYE0_9GAST|nr:Gag-Pol polyprotein [Plakobranchus ocellatus]